MMKRISIVTVAVLVLLAPLALPAGPKDVKLPPYTEHTLKNGLKVFVMETKEVPLVTVRLLVPAGSAHDPSGSEGIANLTGRLLMKGAGGWSAEEISETVDGIGGRLSADPGRDFTLVAGDFMSRDLETALDLLATVVMDPEFLAEEIERERGIVLAEIQSTKERPSSIATREALRELFGEHPYAHPVSGSQASVSGIARGDIVDFHRRRFVPPGSILAVVGDVEATKALKAIRERFGSWRGEAAAGTGVDELAMEHLEGRRVLVIDKPDATQSQIRFGNIAVGRNTPDYFPLLVANNILGGGFTSRLVDEIRVNRGLTYGVGSFMVYLRHGGLFGVYTFTKNATLRETIDVALAEVERIRSEEVGSEELEKSKRYLSGLFPFELETNDDLARWLTELAFYGLDKSVVEKYRTKTGEVNTGDVRRVAQKYFHADGCVIVLLTNYNEVKDQLEGLGSIEVVSIDDLE
ncbi:MAG: insulinase family protein [bacterium]|nr:MAG: insulinase family protein [bacterium]